MIVWGQHKQQPGGGHGNLEVACTAGQGVEFSFSGTQPCLGLVMTHQLHVGGRQNYGPCTLNIRCRSLIGIQKETIILTTTHAPDG